MSELTEADEIMEAIEKSARIDLRDKFAGQALQGLLAADKDCQWITCQVTRNALVSESFNISDAMLRERDK